jgi:phosphoenolpyruvate carboxykinase (ATP)
MINLLDIKTPATPESKAVKSSFGLENHGLQNLGGVYWNLNTPALYEEALFRKEGRIAQGGPFVCSTGKHTARAANDKFVVKEPGSEDHVWWGQYNRPYTPEKFGILYARLQGFLQGHDVFVQDCYVGADPEHRIAVRIITEYAWHSLFARNMFLPVENPDESARFVPEFTLICAPSFQGMPEIDSTATKTFIVLSFDQKIAIIGGTGYAGEIKKSLFTVMNYILPLKGVMSMHCSANVGRDGAVAIFFGLSGTGKTTLSADPNRNLIGDDEHGWSDAGVFNHENGCYAKVISLSATAEPEIYACTHRFGTILENVVYDPVSRVLDLDDDRHTENTRASYPMEFIGNSVPSKRAGHPRDIVMLTCDASGVMPPIARLSTEQALYHFISGYTAKVSGTEMDMNKEPTITFSTCFGGPFMVHHPGFYADLLKRKIDRYGVRCWLVNTGWVGGPYRVGKRISIRHTRALLNAALDGKLDHVAYRQDPVFGFEVPTECDGVPQGVLNPETSWPDQKAYWDRYFELGSRFIDNFKKFADGCPPEVAAAGPKRR